MEEQFVLKSMKLLLVFGIRRRLPEEWMRSIILPIFTKVDGTGFSNYKDISRLSITYKIEFNNLLSKVTANVMVISWDHQCGFRRNQSTTDDPHCIRQILEKNCNKMRQCLSYLETSRRPVIQLGGRICIIFLLSLVSP